MKQTSIAATPYFSPKKSIKSVDTFWKYVFTFYHVVVLLLFFLFQNFVPTCFFDRIIVYAIPTPIKNVKNLLIP